jgi:hypothetical protein
MTDDSDFPSPKEMTAWLQREITDTMKAAELRVRDATSFVSAYAAGEITREEAAERSHQFAKRWGDVLPGVGRSEDLSDSEILKRIDETRVRQLQRATSSRHSL